MSTAYDTTVTLKALVVVAAAGFLAIIATLYRIGSAKKPFSA